MSSLRERGAQVTLLPARAAGESVAGYDLVVLGAPLYSGRWHRDAHRFLRRHRRELSAVPVAVFAMGLRTDTEDAWRRSRVQLDRARAKRDRLNPVAVTVFGGADPPGRSRRPRRDLRSWETIQAWAHRPWPPRADLRKTVRRQASRRRQSRMRLRRA